MTVISSITTLPVSHSTALLVTPTGQLITDGVAFTNEPEAVGLAGFIGISATILGTVASVLENAINLALVSVTGSVKDSLSIGATGVVTANADFATIVMTGGDNVINNAGTVLGGAGLWLADFTGGHVDNSGAITGINFAAIHLMTGSSTAITNTGMICGVAGIEMIGATAHVYNAGTILSTDEARAAVDGAQAASAFTMRNTGDIAGPVTAILGSAFGDTILSTGTVEGVVDLGAGADKFLGRLGLLDSKILGGIGNDLIRSGRGDDAVDGGVGADTLAGNAGDDTLTGGAGADVFVFARNGGDDVITDFVHGTDKINLAAFHFANFAAVAPLLHVHPGAVELDLSSHGGGTVDLTGATLAALTAGDFVL